MRSRWKSSVKTSRPTTLKFSGFDLGGYGSGILAAPDISVRLVAADLDRILGSVVPADPDATVLAGILQLSRPRRRFHCGEFWSARCRSDLSRSAGYDSHS